MGLLRVAVEATHATRHALLVSLTGIIFSRRKKARTRRAMLMGAPSLARLDYFRLVKNSSSKSSCATGS